MEFVLFYELMERELQNAYLLKAELNRRGHELHICDPFRMYNATKEKLDFEPDAILTPYLYEEWQLDTFKSLFNCKIKRIVNLQYEQIFSNNEYELKLHTPDGINKNAIHLCWGKRMQDMLLKGGISKENAPIVGCLNIDMDLDRFESLYKTKEEVSVEYGLNKNKKWILFISSFGMVNLTSTRKEYYSVRHGKIQVEDRIKLEENTRKMLLEWIINYIAENECEFIYRPHPSESVDEYIMDIENRYSNFHIIKDGTVRSWIKVCDKIHIWYSTSISDIYFMKKDCSIIRPIDLLDHMHNDLLNTGKFTRTYEDFCEFNNLDKEIEFPVPKEIIDEYFDVNEEKYAYEKICDLLEDIVKRDVHMEFYEEE